MGIIDVCSYSDPRPAINTTSRSDNWSRGLSPFFLGPCPLYGDYISQNVENGWQYAKVYHRFTNLNDDDPSSEYFEWAKKGWAQKRAERYPMGRGVKPLYSYWDGRKLDYVQARKEIYIPLYARAVVKSGAFARLQEIYQRENYVLLRDFDGYDYRAGGKTLEEVANDPHKKMGHAFVLAMILSGEYVDVLVRGLLA